MVYPPTGSRPNWGRWAPHLHSSWGTAPHLTFSDPYRIVLSTLSDWRALKRASKFSGRSVSVVTDRSHRSAITRRDTLATSLLHGSNNWCSGQLRDSRSQTGRVMIGHSASRHARRWLVQCFLYTFSGDGAYPNIRHCAATLRLYKIRRSLTAIFYKLTKIVFGRTSVVYRVAISMAWLGPPLATLRYGHVLLHRGWPHICAKRTGIDDARKAYDQSDSRGGSTRGEVSWRRLPCCKLQSC